MRSVVVTATLFASLYLGAPLAAAQEAESAPAPAPREGAVRRPQPTVARPPDARSPEDSSNRRAPAEGAVSRARERDATRESAPAPVTSSSAADRRPPDAGLTVSNSDEDQGAQRRGGVRNPRGGGSVDRDTRDRAVRRTTPPRGDDWRFYYPTRRSYRYYGYNPYYDPWGYGGFGLGYFYYAPWGNPGYYGGNPGYYGGYPGRYAPYGYDLGRVKFKVRPRDAEVFVDGYYAGVVDDFDGVFQALKLDSGGYKIEIRKPGYEPLEFSVRVQPDRTLTLRGEMREKP